MTRSAADSARSIEGEDGSTCPVIGVGITSAGHPFCTGTSGVVDAVGGVARFERPYGREAFAHY
ncbi:50S ribosomal protein L31 [Streptomyces sp. NPDC096354]|uniref:50S ribosomal protein L31 n=1 Tax=Streptomyces sp. NPDC096354 TaxID=3366088 RepID=UPI00382A4C09